MDMSTYRKESLESMIKHMPDATYSFREMLLLDSIVLNYDRHMGNYGFMVDNDTFRIVRIAPIFDFDHCLGDYISLQSNTPKEAFENITTKKMPRTECGDWYQQAKMVMTPELRNNMKNMMPFHFKRFTGQYDLDDLRIKFMEAIVNTQIKRILSIT